MARKDKIDISGENSLPIYNPFAHLQIDGLPEGPAPADESPSPAPPKKAKKGRVVLRRETAHRGGKCVIVIDDFAPNISAAEIETLGRKLRNACGCGGTIHQRTIELQGDQPGKIRLLLEQEGFRVAGVS